MERSYWKNNQDQAYRCPRDWRSSAIVCNQLRALYVCTVHHCTIVLRGLRGSPLCRETQVPRTTNVAFSRVEKIKPSYYKDYILMYRYTTCISLYFNTFPLVAEIPSIDTFFHTDIQLTMKRRSGLLPCQNPRGKMTTFTRIAMASLDTSGFFFPSAK